MTLDVHVSHESTPRARGEGLGRAQAEHVRRTIEVYRRLCDLSAGGRVRASDDEHEEIAGIAAGAGVDCRELLAVNARTELIASADECSVVGAGGLLAQNWDWHPDLQDSTLVWVVHERGRWFATVTEAGMLAKIGLNDAGLGVCLNLLISSEDGGLDGVPIHLLLRRVLACRSVDEAVALLTSARVSASSAVTVATPGDVATVELSPGGPNVLRGSTGAHTNHFLEPPPAGRDVGLEESSSTEARLDAIRRLPLLDALRSHEGHPNGVCRHVDESEPWAERTATLASVIMDLAARRLHVAAGQPCTAPHVEIDLAASRSSVSV
ncbi:C45 family autoproteolytic acyltransferase/hydolase [Candidatus Solirubrobacter pratensis]|uniref:C45 family autoproteolytic acyltransferase/hydolase n=1 Tax=Candidatus Solirubrobacter pratensis TaxID=1298857 RepID=UPI000686A4B6|nr:C45 family peptidase [Candidatus Solirubrobacter pratensis]